MIMAYDSCPCKRFLNRDHKSDTFGEACGNRMTGVGRPLSGRASVFRTSEGIPTWMRGTRLRAGREPG